MKRLVDVYPYQQDGEDLQLLVLKRATDVIYAGQWRMVGGKAEEGETHYEAAMRELNEETGLEPTLFWTIPSINEFYDPNEDEVQRIPAFAAKVEKGQDITLNHEHERYKWISPDALRDYIRWPEQRRLMQLLTSITTNNEILEEWIINDTT